MYDFGNVFRQRIDEGRIDGWDVGGEDGVCGAGFEEEGDECRDAVEEVEEEGEDGEEEEEHAPAHGLYFVVVVKL